MSNIWEDQYRSGQGRYFPAEELVRFLGRTYGPVTQKKATGLTAVEIGCGVGGNVLALAQWGFFTYGLELSAEAIRSGVDYAEKNGFSHYKDYRQYIAPGQIHLPSKCANLVLDIQTFQHFNREEHELMYHEVYRLLATSGRFFSIHWCGNKGDGLAIFPGHPELGEWIFGLDIENMITESGLKIQYLETVTKSYGKWSGKWIVIEAVKV